MTRPGALYRSSGVTVGNGARTSTGKSIFKLTVNIWPRASGVQDLDDCAQFLSTPQRQKLLLIQKTSQMERNGPGNNNSLEPKLGSGLDKNIEDLNGFNT